MTASQAKTPTAVPPPAPAQPEEAGIVTQRSGAIMFIALSRPDKLNAFTGAMYDALSAALEEADWDEAIRVVLIHGQGKAFTAGNDIHDFLHAPPSGDPEGVPPTRFFRTISRVRKPIVAAVHGYAVGVGTTMLFHCDLVYAAPDARFQLPFVNLRIAPEAGSSYLLPRIAGYERAAEALLLARPLDAATLHEYGLVTGIVPADELLAAATRAAQELAEKPADALLATKRLMKMGTAEIVAAHIGAEMKEVVRQVQSPDAKEAFTAFLEKRPPRFLHPVPGNGG
jgi:enoyl-CoA hydratase/carnithine racemase